MSQKFSSRKFKGGAYSTMLSALVIVILIVINLLATGLFQTKDLTSLGTYSLSKQTKQYLKGLQEDVILYYIVENGKESVLFTNLAEMFAKENAHISLVYKDPVQYPQFVYGYNNMEEIQSNSIIVVSAADPEKYCYINYEDMCIYQINSDTIPITKTLVGYDAELEIVKGMIQVTTEEFQRAYFTTGHGEESTLLVNEGSISEGLRDLLALNQFESSYVDLSKRTSVPEDCDLLVLGGLTRDLLTEEAGLIREYLERGGNVMVFLCFESGKEELTELRRLMEYYGLDIERGILREGDSEYTMNGDSSYLCTKHEGRNVLWALGSGMSIQETQRDGLTVQALVQTSPNAYVDGGNEESGQTEAGTYTLLAKATETVNGQTGSLYVFNTFLFASDKCLDLSSPLGNRDLLLKQLREVSGAQTEVSIPIKQNKEEALSISDHDKKNLSIVLMGVLPGLFLVAGVVCVYRRRK